jgi:hypothetical protein
MLGHPSGFEIVWCRSVSEHMHEEFPAWHERATHFGEKEFIVFHVLKQFDGYHAVEALWRELMVHNIPCDDNQVLETFRGGDGIDVLFLRARIGESGDERVGTYFGEVKGTGSPAAALWMC